VEKPVHLSLEKAQNIAEKIQSKGLVSSVGYQDRYQDIVKEMKTIVGTDPPAFFTGYWAGRLVNLAWWRDKSKSGGQHVEQTTHVFDMSRYLFGEVESIYAVKRLGIIKDVPNYSIEDATAVMLRFKSGVIGTIYSACCLSVGSRVGMEIFCPDHHLTYSGRSSLEVEKKGTKIFQEVQNDFGLELDRAFIDAVRLKKPDLVKSSYPDAVKSLKLSLLADKSIKENKLVVLQGD